MTSYLTEKSLKMGKPRNSRFINLSDKEILKALLLDLRPANDVSKEESEDKIGTFTILY